MQPENWKLYVIVDRDVARDKDLAQVAEAAIKGGADVIQFRDKTSTDKESIKTALVIRVVTRRHKVPFIINDRVDIAIAADADGVHLGQDDLPVNTARAILGKNKLIGVSTHNLEQAINAQEDGADYIGIGPVYATPTKPDYQPVGEELLKEIKEKVAIPFVAIGGINKDNLHRVLDSGANAVCVATAATGTDDVEAATRLLKNLIETDRKSHDTIRTRP